MTGRFVGIFGDGSAAADERLRAALAPAPGAFAGLGRLRVAFSERPGRPEQGLFCLLDGHLDNTAELARVLDEPADAALERVLRAGYRRWGADLPARLRGEWALLVWDGDRETGLLARDQLGVRPLFVHRTGGELRFAGELDDLLAVLPRRPAPDPTGVAHWIAISPRPGPGTLYEGVERLPGATMLLFDREGAHERRFWQPRFEEPPESSEEQLAATLREALGAAVERRIGAHGSTAVLMSGGLDSASVAALAAERAPGRVSACSGVFPEHPIVDESELIKQLRAALGLTGITAEVRPGGLLASAIEYQRASQLPLLAWGDFWMTPLLRAAAAAGVNTTLGGDGGDELFGARAYLLADRLRAGHPREAVKLALELPGAGERPPRRQVARVVRDYAVLGALPYHAHRHVGRGPDTSRPPVWLLAEPRRRLAESSDPHAWKRLDGPRWWAHVAHGLSQGVQESGIFEHQRSRARLAGVQARQPLFDLDVVELGLRQPPRATFDAHRNRPLLRAAMAGLLPDSVRMRPGKAWFDSLIVDCLTGPDARAVEALLSDPRSELGAYVDRTAMREALLGDGRERGFAWMHQVWRLLSAECWLRMQGDAGWAPAPGRAAPSAPRVSLRAQAAQARPVPFSILT